MAIRGLNLGAPNTGLINRPNMINLAQALQGSAPPSMQEAQASGDDPSQRARRQAMIDALDSGMTQPLGGGGYGEALARFGESYLRTRNGRSEREQEYRTEALAGERQARRDKLEERSTLAQVLGQEAENARGPEQWQDIPREQLPPGARFGQRNNRTNEVDMDYEPAPPASAIFQPPAGYRGSQEGLEPIPGGPQDQRVNEAGRSRIDRLSSSEESLSRALAAIDRAIPSVSGGTSGMVSGGFLRDFNQGAIDLNEALEPVRSILSFETLAEMRRNSETGGALGSIAVRELELLGSTVVSLSTRQSPQQLREGLSTLRQRLQSSRDAVRAARAEAMGGADPQAQAPAAPGQPAAAPSLETMSTEELMAARARLTQGQ